MAAASLLKRTWRTARPSSAKACVNGIRHILSGGGATAGSADRTPESGPRTSICDAVSAAPAAAPTATAAFVDDDGFVAGATFVPLSFFRSAKYAPTPARASTTTTTNRTMMMRLPSESEPPESEPPPPPESAGAGLAAAPSSSAAPPLEVVAVGRGDGFGVGRRDGADVGPGVGDVDGAGVVTCAEINQ